MSSRAQEVEHRSASACSYESSTIAITQNDGWNVATNEADGSNTDTTLTEAQCLSLGTSIRVPPMERKSGGWSSNNFHEHLRLPVNSKPGKGMIIQLQSMSRECLAIALSPYHDYQLGKTYVVHFGANGNLQTVLRRHTNYQECVDVTFPSRVCSENRWISYWIILRVGS